MCGIIAVLHRRSSRPVPSLDRILEQLHDAAARMRALESRTDLLAMAAIAATLEGTDAELRGPPGMACLLAMPHLAGVEQVEAVAAALESTLRRLEQDLDAGDVAWSSDELEAGNALIVRLKDVIWAIGRDRPGTARGIADLASRSLKECEAAVGAECEATIGAFWAIEAALSALDRLEVRGRDSAGLHVLVTGHGIALDDPQISTFLAARRSDDLFTSLAMRTPRGHLSFVYKAAAEIGDLGDNTRALRAAIRSDPVLRLALTNPDAQVTVLGHTRWASVGAISEANAHPVNGEEVRSGDPVAGRDGGSFEQAAPHVVAAVNGDVDNYVDLQRAESLELAPEITTDTKVVSTLVSRRLAAGDPVDEAFCSTITRFEGSLAIGMSAAETPDRLHLALHGSGQSLYVGLAADAFVVASEPYGVVQETATYLPMDGEGGMGRAHGQVVVLERAHAGSLEGVRRLGFDGTPRPVDGSELRLAEITTRDIDRAGFPHFLLKEISESPESFRKTLRGKVSDKEGGLLSVRLGPETLPAPLLDQLSAGAITRIRVVAQGTAAVAGQSVAASIAASLSRLPIAVEAALATEVSGFALADDMSDTLVIAVSQSGTTTDTNRTVDLVRGRGAHVVAIVNRRNSDLVEKSHGVLYTSDGRDVEMSVASTKAFYAQVAAGFLLGLALAQHLGCCDEQRADRLLRALRALPDAMEQVLLMREQIAGVARRVAPSRRHWAVVGNGRNRVAAEEVRIKLSELCYHSIACDGTEDKKHIDLSSEPLVFVCAAGLSGPNADDVAKEVAIYRAHKAAPIVVATEGEAARFAEALCTIEVPAVDPAVAFVLSVMVGHLFGYEAAQAIDSHARPLREARAAIEDVVDRARQQPVDALLKALKPSLETASATFFEGLRAGSYNGNLEAATGVKVASLLRYATGLLPIDGYELEFGKVGSPDAVIGDLAEALTQATSELRRPIDAIKHQAKTVTVGISRSEEALLRVPLIVQALDAGAPMDAFSYRALRTLQALDPAVAEVQGFTRYRIAGDVAGDSTIEVVERGGVSVGLPSRTEYDNRLLGTKHRAAEEREVTVACGARDGRSLILVPETKGNVVSGMTLLHVQFHDTLPAPRAREILSGYRGRYAALADAVTETEASFDDALLQTIPLLQLLTEPVRSLASRWNQSRDMLSSSS
jgi:glucosamine--fructose-6-phosphate aminotransferase (isomerizing)